MQKTSISLQSLTLANPIILAPMAGISNLPYRRIMQEHGAALVFSEMVSANGLIRDGAASYALLDTDENEFPFGIQLFGDDPQVLSKATRRVADRAQVLDINMGCPVKKVIRSGAGSALLRTPERIARIISAVRATYSGPLTVKIRSGWDEHTLNYLRVGKIAEQEGVDAITLHPRTRSQGFGGSARWEQIAELKASLNIPVFGNGDIATAEDALNMLNATACDAVMIGRGAYGNPWLISGILALLAGEPPSAPSSTERWATARRHLELYETRFGARKTMLDMRKHLCWYARGLPGAGRFRARLQDTHSLPEVVRLSAAFFTEEAAA